MKKHKYIGRIFALVITSLFYISNSYCQEVESKYAEIQFNNMPDTDPPLIKILSPVPGEDGGYNSQTEEIHIIGEVTDKNKIKYTTFAGNLISINEYGIFTVKINLNPGINQFELTAADVNDNIGGELLIIDYAQNILTLSDKIKKESNYYGLIIGIDKYEDPDIADLSNPTNDAEKLYKTLTDNYSFEKSNITILRNATRNEIVIALDELSRKVTPEDNVLIFYAGHGTWDERANIGYWLPTDAYLNSTINWFRNSTLVDYLKVIQSKHTLLITDACFAGSIFQTRSVKPKLDRAFEVLYDLNSRKAMTSGTLTEVPDKSPFTKFLIERLEENEKPYLSSEQLYSSFRIAVINNSEAIPQYGEIRNVGDEGGDFIFLKKE